MRHAGPRRTLETALVALALAGHAAAAARDPSGGGPWRVELAGGVSNMQLGDVKDFYNGVLDTYRAGGVPIEPQREFPANLLIGGDVLYEVRPGVHVGVGARYTWTHAYALYGDPGGTLDVNSRMGLTTVALVTRRSWPQAGSWAPFVDVRVGRGFVTIDETETMVLTGAVTGSVEQGLSGHGNAPLAELHLGTGRALGPFIAIGAIGYRYCKVPGPPFDLDMSGFAATFVISLTGR